MPPFRSILFLILCFKAFPRRSDHSQIDPAAATEELQKGICVAFIVVPAIALIIAGVLLLVGFHLTKDKVVQYQNEIAARKAA